MNAKRIPLAFAFFALALFCLSAYTAADAQQLSKQDKTWISKTHQVNLAEIRMGTIAEKTGHGDDVKMTGHILVADHSMLDGELKNAARDLDVSLPTAPTEKQQAEAKKVSGESGAEFDRTWTKMMIEGHRKAIAKTEKEVREGSSPKVKSLASAAVPVLKKHLLLLKGTKYDLSSGAGKQQ